MNDFFKIEDINKNLQDCLIATANIITDKKLAAHHKTFKECKIATPLLLAFSGGGDSTALLAALQKTAPIFGFSLVACHINHGLRGNESQEWMPNFVRKFVQT